MPGAELAVDAISFGFSITLNWDWLSLVEFSALTFIIPPGCLASSVILPEVASIVVPAAGEAVSASRENFAFALAGVVDAVSVVPDSSGIVACDGETDTPVIAASLAGVAGGASSRASIPDAIARHTARLPTVLCIDSTTLSVATGTTAGAATGGAASGAAVECSIARLYRRATRTATITRVELAVGPERDPAAVVDPRRREPGQHRPHPAAEPEPHDPVVGGRREVRVDQAIRAYCGETARPSSPPSPAPVFTPGTRIATRRIDGLG